jgi:hypothetical protein
MKNRLVAILPLLVIALLLTGVGKLAADGGEKPHRDTCGAHATCSKNSDGCTYVAKPGESISCGCECVDGYAECYCGPVMIARINVSEDQICA